MRDAFGEIIAEQNLEVPPVLLRFHNEPPERCHGIVKVEGGSRWARMLAALAGFPPPMDEVRFRLDVRRHGQGHIWQRRFGRRQTRSHLRYDRQRGRAVERFGPIELELSAEARHGTLQISVAEARVFGLPLPRWLRPVSASVEYETPDGHFGFDIAASLPRIGLLIRYSGHIVLPELDLRR